MCPSTVPFLKNSPFDFLSFISHLPPRVCAALDFCCDAPVLPGDDPIPTEARLAFFNETRHSYGRTALMLSGGAALGFYHMGVMKALMENGLMPRVLSGGECYNLSEYSLS